MTASLALRDITCVRGGRTLFAGLSLRLASGDAAWIAGPNGAGKSSLIRICADLLVATAGSVERRGDVALLGEASALDSERTLHDALAFWARIDGRGDAVTGALDAVGLASLAQVPVRILSTGQRRRAALARVVAGGAPIWLLDEPASGLDVPAVATLERLIATHRAAGGIVVLASHQPVDLPGAATVRL